jgi:fluoride exporter
MRVLVVALAGAAGAVTRYGIGRAVGARSFPWATLLINVTGSFLLGAVLGAAVAREWSPTLVVALGTGFLGAYTTFSTFSFETFDLARQDRLGLAATYVALSIACGVTAAAGGWAVGRHAL